MSSTGCCFCQFGPTQHPHFAPLAVVLFLVSFLPAPSLYPYSPPVVPYAVTPSLQSSPETPSLQNPFPPKPLPSENPFSPTTFPSSQPAFNSQPFASNHPFSLVTPSPAILHFRTTNEVWLSFFQNLFPTQDTEGKIL